MNRKARFRAIAVAMAAFFLIAWFLFPGSFGRGVLVGVLSTFVSIIVIAVIGSRVIRKRFGNQLKAPPVPAGAWDYEMEATDLSGQPVSFSSFEGKVLVLNFWATWCAPCVAEMPSLQRMLEKTSDLDVHLACVTREPAETVGRFLEKREMGLPIYLTDTDPPECFKGRGIPATFVLDKNGMIVMRHFGAARWDADEVVTFLRGLAATPDS